MSLPNILFIMTDQHRWDALGCAGGWVKTPNLDGIATGGLRFSNCVTNSPVCIPARVTLATGLYPHNTDVWDNCFYTLSPDSKTWMQAIRDAGYRTSLFGKTHLHPHTGEEDPDLREKEHLLRAYGLDDIDEIGGPLASARVWSHMTAYWESKGLWDAYKADYAERRKTKPHLVRPSTHPLEDYADVYVGRKAAEYLQAYDGNQPWFCWVSFGGPHSPWDTPEPYASMYDPSSMPPPIERLTSEHERPRGDLDEAFESDRFKFDPGDIEACRANYAGNVTLIDEQIGRILEIIEKRCELENTVIAFTSDHGELNGDHGLLYKSRFLNGCVRVPLLLSTPETRKHGGAVCEQPVEMFDIGPTLAELAGASIDHPHFALSLCPLLKEPSAPHREEAVSEIHGEMMIQTDRWRMSVNRKGEPYLLFDLIEDPDESRNQAGNPELADTVADLTQRLFRFLQANKLQHERGGTGGALVKS